MPSSAAARRWLGLGFLALGVSLIVVDTTIVNVIVPSLVSELGVSSVQAQWIQESYPIVLAALLLPTGRLCDIFGARRLFLTGVTLFVAASVLASVAPNGAALVAARFLQGVAAAMIMPSSLAIVNTAYTGVDRGRAFAVWGATIGVSAAVGPLLGGALAELSWRWVFGINVLLGAVIVAGVALFFPASTRLAGTVDMPGAIASVAGFGLLAFGLIEGRSYGWIASIRPVEFAGVTWHNGPSVVLIAFVVAVIALAAFVRRQRVLTRGGRVDALLDVRLFSIRSFRYGNFTLLIVALGELGIIAVLPLWLQFTLDYSPLQSGLALVPLAVGTFVASTASMSLVARFAPVRLVRLGLILEIVALVVLGSSATPDTPWWPIALALFVLGIGNGFASAQIANVILAGVPPSSAGQGAAVQATTAQIGSALGIAVLTTTYFTVLGMGVRDRLTGAGIAHAQDYAASVTASAGAVISSMRADPGTAAVAEAARAAMSQGVGTVGYVAAALLAAALLATALIPRPGSRADTGSDRADTTAETDLSVE
ncbi:DHA2 family efflux MFS transporter permease subunit [Nocardia transvalensis]|uniref:DHA2 family efflux MFS transporter permease subunit n=1 Tax=Nocardia transvalensis TaxID=37333 RepID=UPI001895A194|nr:DHA2 family efflux MFS transporter permease subunit [Nocardia transvalensis]MBF6330410.1 DHA2 family efflux MFS transporter permease subunit [Nocardia transvalensis]